MDAKCDVKVIYYNLHQYVPPKPWAVVSHFGVLKTHLLIMEAQPGAKESALVARYHWSVDSLPSFSSADPPKFKNSYLPKLSTFCET
jgi:hypothetical protein